MPVERRWRKQWSRITLDRREWTFLRSQGWTPIVLLILPFVWWYDPWDCTACDRQARNDLVLNQA